MKVQAFLDNEKIPAARAAGFLSHLRATPEHDFSETHLAREYARFRGLPAKQEKRSEETRVPAATKAAQEKGGKSLPEA